MTTEDLPHPPPQFLYAVVFERHPDARTPENPPITVDQLATDDRAVVPHGLARDAARALPGLWYCLHLPGSPADLRKLAAWQVQGLYQLARGHNIVLLTLKMFEKHQFSRTWRPMLAVCPDDLANRTRQRAEALGFELPTATFSELSDDSLAAHWNGIHQAVSPDSAMPGGAPALTRRLDLAATELPQRLLARQAGWPSEQPTDEDQLTLVRQAREGRATMAVTARLELDGNDSAADALLPRLAAEAAQLGLPVTLALPGVAPAYTRGAYDPRLRAQIRPTPEVDAADVWAPDMTDRPNALIERAAIEFLTTSRSVADGGIGLTLRSVPPSAFTALAELEKHFVAAKSDQPSSVRKLLSRLNAAVRPLLTEPVIEAIKCASHLTIFTNFPLGVVTLPGDTAPLAARLPVTYEPLLPLTRALQRDFTAPSNLDWSNGIRVLIAECIPDSDPVGRASRIGWRDAQNSLRTAQNVKIVVRETPSVEALRQAVDEHAPDMLILSAHGRVRDNAAGLMIGEQSHLTLGLERPPAVIALSACHVAPRGAGTVSVTDFLLHEGACAVLGTQVPVDVRRNAVLMSRFLGHIEEGITDRRYATLLNLWHNVQMSSTLSDIIMSTPSLTKWATTPGPSGVPPVNEFMNRSPRRLRAPHIYQDSEQLLGEIADEAGCGPQVRNWFRRPGYVPESLFYLFAGRPERIHISPLLERIPGVNRSPGL
ncbi:CHAT domain-containing protein [Kitasatospora sp. NPDC052896]|uniref:CHAT domain-containing protein n=1 Tax=Kitasatospora sp. NPDC052896 TaxID=3364061 RepID=UPI0037C64734